MTHERCEKELDLRDTLSDFDMHLIQEESVLLLSSAGVGGEFPIARPGYLRCIQLSIFVADDGTTFTGAGSSRGYLTLNRTPEVPPTSNVGGVLAHLYVAMANDATFKPFSNQDSLIFPCEYRVRVGDKIRLDMESDAAAFAASAVLLFRYD